MNFKAKYNLFKEEPPTTVDGELVDYEKFKVTSDEGTLKFNKYACQTCGFTETMLVDVYSNPAESILAIAKAEEETGHMLKVTKSLQGTISVRHLLIKMGYTSTTPVKVDVVEAGDGFVVLGFIRTSPDTDDVTAPFGPVSDTVRIHRELGEKLAGSDF